MRWLMVLGVLGWWMLEAQAAMWQACVEHSTGRPFQTQLGGTPGACAKDVEANPQYGWTASDIEERLLTEEEHRALQATWRDSPKNPDVPKRQSAKAERKAKEERLLVALNLTPEQLRELKDLVRQGE